MSRGLILYAPNVHTGGGLVLLKALLDTTPSSIENLKAFLDLRARGQIAIPAGALVSWVEARVGSRLKAELDLRRTARESDTVLCFHGLPPLLPVAGRTIVFVQNKLLLGAANTPQFTGRTRWRLAAERWLARSLRDRVRQYVVQTSSMAAEMERWLGAHRPHMPVRVLPFLPELPPRCERLSAPAWDFIYVADGLPHKNHRHLIAAWEMLAAQGLRPTLALTLPRGVLWSDITAACSRGGMRIQNLGPLSHEEVLRAYSKSGALIFASTTESFGLPLIEARHAGVPILAPELDYVRDVCDPVQTFDAQSTVSIARAVRRFLGRADIVPESATAQEFWRELLAQGEAS